MLFSFYNSCYWIYKCCYHFYIYCYGVDNLIFHFVYFIFLPSSDRFPIQLFFPGCVWLESVLNNSSVWMKISTLMLFVCGWNIGKRVVCVWTEQLSPKILFLRKTAFLIPPTPYFFYPTQDPVTPQIKVIQKVHFE